MPIHAAQKLRVFLVFGGVLASLLFWMSGSFAQDAPKTKPPTFYRDVLPILEQHCQSCHRAGGIAPTMAASTTSAPSTAAIRPRS